MTTDTRNAGPTEADCLYPECLINGSWKFWACEHSCPWQSKKAAEARAALKENAR